MLDKLTALRQKLGAGMGLLIGNLVWLLTDQILPMGLGLLVGVWVASYRGRHNLACSITRSALCRCLLPQQRWDWILLWCGILLAIPNARKRLWGLLLSYNWQGESLLYCWR